MGGEKENGRAEGCVYRETRMGRRDWQVERRAAVKDCI